MNLCIIKLQKQIIATVSNIYCKDCKQNLLHLKFAAPGCTLDANNCSVDIFAKHFQNASMSSLSSCTLTSLPEAGRLILIPAPVCSEAGLNTHNYGHLCAQMNMIKLLQCPQAITPCSFPYRLRCIIIQAIFLLLLSLRTQFTIKAEKMAITPYCCVHIYRRI